MLRALLASFVFSFSLLLAACGGDSASAPASAGSPPAMPASVAGSGNVVKGLIRNGVVSAWRWEAGAYVQVASARTGAGGDFVLDIPDPVAGEVLRLQLDVSSDTSPGQRTEMLCDVAQCGSAVRGEWVPLASGMGLRSWASVGAGGVVTLMPMSPVSTLLVSHAESLNDGHLTAAAVDVARLRVAELFGMTPQQLLSRPGNILDSLWLEAASPEAMRLSVLSAAMAELSTLSGYSIDQVMSYLAERFNAHDGHLMQAGELGSLADVYQSAASLAASNPAVQAKISSWLTAAIAGLHSGQLNTATCGESCVAFDSNDVLNALGTGSDTLGGDLRRLMAEQGANRIEDLLAAQLAQYGWLATPDSVALAGVALDVGVQAAIASAGLGDATLPGVTVVREGNVLHFDGTYNGFVLDLDITVPPLSQQIYDYVPGSVLTFVIGAQGTVQNDHLRARLDGNLTIVADGTDFTPAKSALTALLGATLAGDAVAQADARKALLAAVASIIRTGEGTFILQGSAALAKLELQGDALAETSQLAISGRGQLHVDMDGLDGGGIAAEGRADYGTLTLPTGDTFTIDPARGHALSFALGADGTATVNIGAHVLGHDATVSGSGRLVALGPMLGHLRDNAAYVAENLTEALAGNVDLSAPLAQLLADLKALTLTVNGQAVIPDYGHTYMLTIANGVLALSQPDSAATALKLEPLAQGLLARAGEQWWLVGADLSTPGYPAVTLADSRGGEWRWDFNFAGLLAAL